MNEDLRRIGRKLAVVCGGGEEEGRLQRRQHTVMYDSCGLFFFFFVSTVDLSLLYEENSDLATPIPPRIYDMHLPIQGIQ